jgi:hypothetical protein
MGRKFNLTPLFKKAGKIKENKMKKNRNTKTITLTGLAALSAFAATMTPFNAMAHQPARMSHQRVAPLVEQVELPPQYVSEQVDATYSEDAAVDEMIALCNDRTTFLQRALVQANLASRHDLNQAATMIANAITQAASVPQFRVGTGHFHFVVALRAASGVVSAIMSSTASGTLGPILAAQIRYGVLAELAELVINAHKELDVQFVQPVFQECGYGCWGHRDLPQDYYNGVARLAAKFMDLMTSSAEGTPERNMLGSVKVELAVTKAAVHAAKIVLINSRLRESYASNIYALQNLEVMISEMLVPGGLASEEPQEARAIVRSQFDCIKIYPYVY